MLVSYRSGVGMRCDRAGRVCEVRAAAVASEASLTVAFNTTNFNKLYNAMCGSILLV